MSPVDAADPAESSGMTAGGHGLIRSLGTTMAAAMLLAGCATSPAGGPLLPGDQAVGVPQPMLGRVPVEFAGMSRGEIERLLGPPDFHRHDQPAVYMHYAFGGCMVDLFLYADARSGEHHVVHYEFRDRVSAVEGCTTTVLRVDQGRRRTGELPAILVH